MFLFAYSRVQVSLIRGLKPPGPTHSLFWCKTPVACNLLSVCRVFTCPFPQWLSEQAAGRTTTSEKSFFDTVVSTPIFPEDKSDFFKTSEYVDLFLQSRRKVSTKYEFEHGLHPFIFIYWYHHYSNLSNNTIQKHADLAALSNDRGKPLCKPFTNWPKRFKFRFFILWLKCSAFV